MNNKPSLDDLTPFQWLVLLAVLSVIYFAEPIVGITVFIIWIILAIVTG